MFTSSSFVNWHYSSKATQKLLKCLHLWEQENLECDHVVLSFCTVYCVLQDGLYRSRLPDYILLIVTIKIEFSFLLFFTSDLTFKLRKRSLSKTPTRRNHLKQLKKSFYVNTRQEIENRDTWSRNQTALAVFQQWKWNPARFMFHVVKVNTIINVRRLWIITKRISHICGTRIKKKYLLLFFRY